jgi:hypothetical protein
MISDDIYRKKISPALIVIELPGHQPGLLVGSIGDGGVIGQIPGQYDLERIK